MVQKSDRDFKELMGNRLHNLSQLQKFEIGDDDGEHFGNIFEAYNIIEEIKNNEDYIIFHNVEHSDGWDNIAYKHYENEKLGGIVALTNDIINPFEELSVGDKIKVIDNRWLYKIIKNLKKTSR